MASHDQLDAAPSASPDVVPGAAPSAAPHVVPIVAPNATPDVVPTVAPHTVPAPAPTVAQVDAVPIVAPHVVPDLAHHAARGGARATASSGAHGVPRCRARRAARVLDPSAAPIPGQVAPAAPAGGPATQPPRIDINVVFAFSE
jgi:hypothetical protein